MQRKTATESHNIEAGDVYVDAKLPRHEWRVAQTSEEIVTLERIDKPSILRFVNPAGLRDTNRYQPKR